MKTTPVPVILCGGAGTRLWPESRGARAKQFLHLDNPNLSLLQQTLMRSAHVCPGQRPTIVCGHAHAVEVEAQSVAIDVSPRLIVEPFARNTAPAIALAALSLDPESLMLVMPSDHVVRDSAAFGDAVRAATPLAADNWLVTFGIEPDRAETGFGYIARGAALSERGFTVSRFVEKPDAGRAQAMIDAGGHSWNAGIFLMRAGALLAAMADHCPDVLAAAKASIKRAERSEGTILANADAFAQSPSVAIDVAVMERADRVAVVPVSMGWSDIGSWHAVHSLAARDDAGNAALGDVLMIDSTNCLVRAGEQRVSLIGVEGLAVLVDGQDILIMPLERAQDVKQVAEARRTDV